QDRLNARSGLRGQPADAENPGNLERRIVAGCPVGRADNYFRRNFLYRPGVFAFRGHSVVRPPQAVILRKPHNAALSAYVWLEVKAALRDAEHPLPDDSTGSHETMGSSHSID